MQLELLDCTLRDGGYYTNWDFNPDLVKKYIQTLSELPIKYIEIGYRNLPQAQYYGQYFYLPNSTVKNLFNYSSHKINAAVMLDVKNCSIDSIPLLLKNCTNIIELVRLAVNPSNLDNAISIAKEVKRFGFKVAINLMYLSKIHNNYQLLSQFEPLANDIDYLYLVDSYGSCFPQQVEQAVQFAKNNLPQKIGFHGHDNLGLAFANTLAAWNSGVDIVDSTVLGMGRGAGNLRTELIVSYLSHLKNDSIDLSPLADLLIDFHSMKDSYRWGSDLPYIISGLWELPQKNVMELLGKKRYSTSFIVKKIQGNLQNNLINNSYPKFNNAINNIGLQDIDNCIIIGGGSTASQHHQAIIEYARDCNSILIHSSLKSAEFYRYANIPQVLCLPGREAEKLKLMSNNDLERQFVAYILSTEPRMESKILDKLATKTFEVEPIIQVNYSNKIASIEGDSPLGLALGVVQEIGIKKVFIAGFDGYSKGNEVQKELAAEVQQVINLFSSANSDVEIKSLTPTLYSVKHLSVYAALSSLK